MKRPKYSGDEFKVLEYLATKATDGMTERTTVQSELKLPKSSLTDVLHSLEDSGFIVYEKWFGNAKRIRLTEKGRDEYNRRVGQLLNFSNPPYAVTKYLGLRKPQVKPDSLFPIQRMFVDRGLIVARNNAAVFAYPGSGKTLVAEMAAAYELNNKGRILYCTPYKALDWQKYSDFEEWFGKNLNAKVVVADGDNSVRREDISSADLVIATYERVFGAIKMGEPWIRNISLIVADEITLLDDDWRGGTLDFVLTHFKIQNNAPRIITLSSLVGNPLQISDWINAKTVIENRPLPHFTIVEQIVFANNDSKIEFMGKDGESRTENTEEQIMDHIVKKILKAGQTSIVFMGSRPATVRMAQKLAACHPLDPKLQSLSERFFQEEVWEDTDLNRKLLGIIGHGIAFHHAGLQRKVRRFVETLLKDGKLKTVVATTTLSHGVDYSIDNVIIDLPGIGRVKDLHAYEYINMKGRTGRPGKSKTANIYVVTNKENAAGAFKKYFLSSPEEISPRQSFTDENVSTIILMEAQKGQFTIEKVNTFLESTLSRNLSEFDRRITKRVMNRLVKLGCIRRSGKEFILAELGKRVIRSNLSVFDAESIMKMPQGISQTDFLAACSYIDMARRVRQENQIPGERVAILEDWINEVPIDKIEKWAFEDQDVFDLGEYTSIAIQKVAKLLPTHKYPFARDILEERVRLGIKSDLVESGLFQIATLRRDRNRLVARRLFESKFSSIEKVASSDASTLAGRAHIPQVYASKLIEDAKMAISSVRERELLAHDSTKPMSKNEISSGTRTNERNET